MELLISRKIYKGKSSSFSMEKEIKRYYDNLKIVNAIKEHLNVAREAFEETLKTQLDKLEEVDTENYELKKEISDKSVDKFKETGEKKLDFGLGIRVTNKLEYDEDSAIEWASNNMPIAVKQVIDKKQFETFAKGNELDFVEKIENITVTFPKELKE